MDDRKYQQRGYMDSDRDNSVRKQDERPKGPRLPLDVTGPRLPRLVQSVVASRCYHCATTLPTGTDFKSNCPKCGMPLHCCKQCAHFEPSTRFQCLKPIVVRIASKDGANDCASFSARVTVARDGTSGGPAVAPAAPAPRNPSDARAAFDQLFKK
ncbi:MAG TPA: hypothetical protein VHA11_06570 [Bryobacteraceae bacterium]|nr:hypothetical protein [Bryobacteraceae bacterium]